MLWKISIIAIFILSGWFKAGAQELPLTHFTSDSEVKSLPSALVTHAYQDTRGYIWFANYTSGLVRYDGSTMKVYDEIRGLRDRQVWQIIQDKQGYLWASSAGGIMVSEKSLSDYIRSEEINFTSVYGVGLLSDEAVSRNQQLAADNADRIWLGTSSNGIIRYKIGQGRVSTDSLSTKLAGEENLGVTSLISTRDNRILAALRGGILVDFSGNLPKKIYDPINQPANWDIISLHEDRKNRIWAYRENGDILFFNSPSELPRIIPTGSATNFAHITSLKDGTIIAGGESGIVSINPETLEILHSYTKSNGLLSNEVYHILEDREGNVWISQSGGVSKLRYNFNAFENYTSRAAPGEKPVLVSGKLSSIQIPSTGPCRFYVGAEGGVTCVGKDGSSSFLTREDGLISDWVNGLRSDKEGRLWIATNRGLNVLSFKKDLPIKENVEIREVLVQGRTAYLYTLKETAPFIASEELRIQGEKNGSSQESLWFIGWKSLLVFLQKEIYELGPQHGLPPTLYKSVAIDPSGFLWVGTREQGLYRSTIPLNSKNIGEITKTQQNLFENVWSVENGAPTNHIEKLLWYEGKLYAGTPNGLFVLDPTSHQVLDYFNTERGLPADNAIGFDVSPTSGHLWVGTNKGLAEVDIDKNKVLKVVTRQDGLVDNEVWLYGSVKVDKTGKVYYGTAGGLSIYNPEKDYPNVNPPKLELSSFEISYKEDSRNDVAFEYAALSYSNPAAVRYQTRLLGYDNNWSPPTEVRRLRYTNLPAYLLPKQYILEITAMNESGVVVTEPVRFSFMIEPVWWLQWYSFLILLIVLGGVIYTVSRLQRKKLIMRERNNARVREAELQAETAIARSNAAESEALALQAENEKKAIELEKVRELEKAYNKLKATQKQLIQAEKMASLGRLATGVAHEIKNPLNFINNFAELSVELVGELEEARKNKDEEEIDYLMQDLKLNAAKIGEHGKRADAIVRSMMQHARGGKKELESFNLNELVKDFAGLAYHGKKTKQSDLDVQLVYELGAEVGEVIVVGQQIGQVLINIIGNSLDAVQQKKKDSGAGYKPWVKIKTLKKDEYFEIRVSDNGPGVPENIREKIFEPFFTTKPTGQGTGLGLSLSYNIITEAHNGSLKLVSKKGEGAMFIISLPVSQEKPSDVTANLL